MLLLSLIHISFDPVTNGHLDIGNRAASLFDELIFAVAVENYKNTLFNLQERISLIQQATAHLPNVSVEGFDGLLVDYCQKKNATVVVRGLRAISDFEREFQMALIDVYKRQIYICTHGFKYCTERYIVTIVFGNRGYFSQLDVFSIQLDGNVVCESADREGQH